MPLYDDDGDLSSDAADAMAEDRYRRRRQRLRESPSRYLVDKGLVDDQPPDLDDSEEQEE